MNYMACRLANKGDLIPEFLRKISRRVKIMSGGCGKTTKHIHLSYILSDGVHCIVSIDFHTSCELNALEILYGIIGNSHKNTMGIVRGRCKHVVVFVEAQSPGVVRGGRHKFECRDVRFESIQALLKI